MTQTSIQGLPYDATADALKVTGSITTTPALGANTMANSQSVTIATDDARIGIVTETAPATDTASSGLNGRLQRIAQRLTSLILTAASTGAQTIVAGSATPVTILAANASRKGAMVYNDSSAVLYLLLGAGTASATVHTVQLMGGQYYEVPLCSGGVPTVILTGLWASATGSARVTELT